MGVLIHLESNKLKKGQKKIAPPDAKRYAVCGMNDKLNPFPRVNSPLFSPEDPESGFSSGSGGPSRRKFLKRTGGATMATFISFTLAQKSGAIVSIISEKEVGSGHWSIRAKKFGKSQLTYPGGHELSHQWGGVPEKRIFQETNYGSVDDGNSTYPARTVLSLWLAQDGKDTDSNTQWKSTALNAGRFSISESVEILVNGNWIDAGSLSTQYAPTPLLIDKAFFLQKDISNSRPETSIIANSDNYEHPTSNICAKWKLDDEGEETDILEIRAQYGGLTLNFDLDVPFEAQFD